MFRTHISGVVVAIAAAAVVSGCAHTDQPVAATAPSAATPAVGIETLRENPGEYVGETVTLQAEVEEVLGPRLMKLSQDNPLGLLENEVFVYVPKAIAVAVREDQEVKVTGTFTTFMDVDIEDELGWFEPEPDLEAELDRQYVVVATQVRTWQDGDLVVWSADQQGLPRASTAAAGDRAAGTSGAGRATAGVVTSVAPLVEDEAEELVGRWVSLQAPVGRVIGDRTFTIGAGDEQLLALVAEPIGAPGAFDETIQPGSQVEVSGIVLAVPDDAPLSNATAEAQPSLDDREVYIYATNIAAVPSQAQAADTAPAAAPAPRAEAEPQAQREMAAPDAEPAAPETDVAMAEPTPAAAAPATEAEETPMPTGTSGQTVPGADTPEQTAPQEEPAMPERANELPRTASLLPLSGLIGLLSLGGALGLRASRRGTTVR